jgi:hypothetical protein
MHACMQRCVRAIRPTAIGQGTAVASLLCRAADGLDTGRRLYRYRRCQRLVDGGELSASRP